MRTAVRIFSTSITRSADPGPVRGAPLALWDFGSGEYTHTWVFSRNSIATNLSEAGTIETFAANVPRYSTIGGLLFVRVEGSSKNLLTHSSALVGAGWSASGSTGANLGLNAMGQFPGVQVSGTGAAWNRLLHSNQPSCTAGVPMAMSIWLRAGTSGRTRIILRDMVGNAESHIAGTIGTMTSETISAGSVTNLAQVLQQDGSTIKLTFTFTPNYTGSVSLGVGPDSTTSGATVIVLGAQVETGASPSSFIPTAGATVTRLADVLEFHPSAGMYDARFVFADASVSELSAVQIPGAWSPAISGGGLRSVALYPAGTLA